MNIIITIIIIWLILAIVWIILPIKETLAVSFNSSKSNVYEAATNLNSSKSNIYRAVNLNSSRSNRQIVKSKSNITNN